MFISVKVKINYNPFSRERLKKIWLVLFPIMLSLIVTISDRYLGFMEYNQHINYLVIIKLVAIIFAVLQVAINYKGGVYKAVEGNKNALKTFAISGVFLIIANLNFTELFNLYPRSADLITNSVWIVLSLIQIAFVMLLDALFNPMYALGYEPIHTMSLSCVLVSFFTVYSFLGAAICLAKTLKQNQSLELAK